MASLYNNVFLYNDTSLYNNARPLFNNASLYKYNVSSYNDAFPRATAMLAHIFYL